VGGRYVEGVGEEVLGIGLKKTEVVEERAGVFSWEVVAGRLQLLQSGSQHRM
jgi:hypothetical protein